MFPILTESPLFRGLDQQTINSLLERVSYTTAVFNHDDCIAKRDMA